MVLSFLLLFIVAGIATEQVPPESLYKIIHIEFPKDRLTTQILRIQRDMYGMTKFPCSSLLGPHCAPNQALNELSASTQTPRGTAQNRGGSSKGNSVNIDSGQIPMTGELRGVWENIDPAILTEVADRIAEIAPVENQEAFRHKVLSAFANVLARVDNDDEEEEGESKQGILNAISVQQDGNVVVRLDQRNIDTLLKAVQDTVVDLIKTDGTTESTSNEEEEEEEEDIYIDEEDEYED